MDEEGKSMEVLDPSRLHWRVGGLTRGVLVHEEIVWCQVIGPPPQPEDEPTTISATHGAAPAIAKVRADEV